MPPQYILRLRPGASLPPGVPALLSDGATTEQLAGAVRRTDGPDALARLFYLIERLRQRGAIEYLLRLSDGSHVCLRPHRADFRIGAARVDHTEEYDLSRFALLRREHDSMVLESPVSSASLIFDSWIPAAIMTAFRAAARPLDCVERVPAPAAADVLPIAEMLLHAGFLEKTGKPATPSLALWDFHELLFHERSSSRRVGEPFGAQVPHRKPEPPSVIPAPVEGIELRAPDLRDDASLTWVMENRRSSPRPGPAPLTVAQLSEFLFRAARRLPSAGGRNELEFYAAVNSCLDLAPGFYHYYAPTHRLQRLPAAEPVVNQMLHRAALSWSTGRNRPDVLIVVATRFTRMASRYAAIAYRNTLLDAGIALEAMYLVATAMHLGPCALGLNLPQLFAEATGLDRFEETSLALFALNATAADPLAPGKS